MNGFQFPDANRTVAPPVLHVWLELAPSIATIPNVCRVRPDMSQEFAYASCNRASRMQQWVLHVALFQCSLPRRDSGERRFVNSCDRLGWFS